MAFDALFQPFELKNLKLANRFVMAPMTRSFSPDQVPGPDVAAYYRRRAEGGVGLIVTEGVTLEGVASSNDERVPKMAGDAALEGWRRVVEEVHAAGGKIAPQLWHVGALRRADKTLYPDVPTQSPSGMATPGKRFAQGVTEDEIAGIVRDYGQAAKNAMALGFDAVEIHGAHGYLIDQFFWSGTNERTDRYGGDLVARTAFAREVIGAVREAIGPEKALILRISQWKQQEYTARLADTPEELEAFLGALSDAGVDMFHCSQRRYWEPEWPELNDLNFAGWTKKLTGKPAITVGSVGLSEDFISAFASDTAVERKGGDIEDLNARVERGEFDLVAVGRAMIANPDWVEKVRRGAENELRNYERAMLGELA